MKNENEVKKTFLPFGEFRLEHKNRPKRDYLWRGIKVKSFGLIFGPAKSGKTIFCENLAINIAIGSKSYLDSPLSGVPKKVLFVGLEEFWESRAERNTKQYQVLDEKEQELMSTNFMVQPLDFSKKIIKKSDWDSLRESIIDSKAEVVFIDSITRMNHGNLLDSKTAEEIMQELRDLGETLGITLICIHHTPKIQGYPITMDSIKGSSTFSAESDFAIGINRTVKNYRYVKDVFYRDAKDDYDVVNEFEIDENTVINYVAEVDEDELLMRSDRRRADNKTQKVLNYFLQNPDTTFSREELINNLKPVLKVKDRMVENYLKKVVDDNLIDSPERGYYKAIKTIKNGKS